MIIREIKPAIIKGDAAQSIIGVTKVTIERLLALDEYRAEAMALYLFYCYTARWQRYSVIKATTSYVAKGLGWSQRKVGIVKKILIQLGLVETISKRSKDGRVTDWRIMVNYLVGYHSYDGRILDQPEQADQNAESAHLDQTANSPLLVKMQTNLKETLRRENRKEISKEPRLLEVEEKAAKPRSIDEVVAFCLSIGATQSDGEYFWHHWDDNGFTNKGKPIKKWKSVILAWKSAGHLPSTKQTNGQKPKEVWRGNAI